VLTTITGVVPSEIWKTGPWVLLHQDQHHVLSSRAGWSSAGRGDLRPDPILFGGIDADLVNVADHREAGRAREVGNADTEAVDLGGADIHQHEKGEQVGGREEWGVLYGGGDMVCEGLDRALNHVHDCGSMCGHQDQTDGSCTVYQRSQTSDRMTSLVAVLCGRERLSERVQGEDFMEFPNLQALVAFIDQM
jgi:hypothetical protein